MERFLRASNKWIVLYGKQEKLLEKSRKFLEKVTCSLNSFRKSLSLKNIM